MPSPRIFRSVIFSPLILLSIVGISLAQGGNYTVEGRVLTPELKPPPRTNVTLMLDGAMVSEAVTDVEGHYFFSNVGIGVYQVVAHSDGRDFEDTTATIEVSSLRGISSVFRLDIQLRPKQKTTYAVGTISAEENDKAIPEEARKNYKSGVKNAKDNNPDKAIKYFESAVQTYPKFSLAELALGDEYAKVGKLAEAVSAYKKVLEIRPELPAALRGLGIAFVKEKSFADALAPLKRSVALDLNSADGFLFLGFAEMETGDVAAAETDMLQAYKLSKSPAVHLHLANLYLRTKNNPKAIEQLEAFVNERPDDPRVPKIREAIAKLRKADQKH